MMIIIIQRCNMGAMKTRTTTMAATATIANSMANTTKTMKTMNKQMDVGKMQDQMREFMQANQQMEMTEEMMDDALIDAFDDDETEEDADALTQQVLDEIGIDMAGGMAAAPTHNVATKSAGQSQQDKEAAALLAELGIGAT